MPDLRVLAEAREAPGSTVRKPMDTRSLAKRCLPWAAMTTLAATVSSLGGPSVFPTGVTIYDPKKAFNGFVLFDGRDERSYLIDMNGRDVHTWRYSGFPVEMIDPALNKGRRGHVLLQKEPNNYENRTLLELDWEGNVVWEWGQKAPGGRAAQTHDLARLPNGNTLVLSMRAACRRRSPRCRSRTR